MTSRKERDRELDLLFDDADSIAHFKKEQAVAAREVSAAGLLRMLEHEGGYDDDAIVDVVIDPELLQMVAERAGLAAEVVPLLREKIPKRRGNTQRRYFYALVRIAGPEAPEVARLLGGTPPMRQTALEALACFRELPESLLPLLEPLVREHDSGVLVSVVMRIRSERIAPLLLAALDRDSLRAKVLDELTRPGMRPSALASVPPEIVARFEAACAKLEPARKTGLPDRVELLVAASIAALVGPHPALARRTLSVFDIVPGVLPKNERFGDPTARARVIRQRLVPFVRLLAGTVDALGDAERTTLAGFLAKDPPERWPAAAAAWVRLPEAAARGLMARWPKLDRALEDARWEAAARAFAALPSPPAWLAALFPDRAMSTAHATAAPVELDATRIQEMAKKAASPAELRAALELAARHATPNVLRIALAKLREQPFRLDAAMEAALAPLVDDDAVPWIEDEIAGENPFADRRAALKKLLSSRRG